MKKRLLDKRAKHTFLNLILKSNLAALKFIFLTLVLLAVFVFADGWTPGVPFHETLYTDRVTSKTDGVPVTVDDSLLVTGNVGIGTANPEHSLDVAGDVRWSGTMQGGSVPWTSLTDFPAACPSGQYATSIGSVLTCAAPEPGGITSETDPQVGTLSSGKWCTSDGNQVNCDAAPPAGITCTQVSEFSRRANDWRFSAQVQCPSGYFITSGGVFFTSFCGNLKNYNSWPVGVDYWVIFAEFTMSCPETSGYIYGVCCK